MCSHLNMNTKPISGFLALVIALSLSCLLLSLRLSLPLLFSISRALSTLWIGLWQYYDAFLIIFITLAKLPCLSGPLGSLHWLLAQPEGYRSLSGVSEQRWDQEMDSILQQIIQLHSTNGYTLCTVHCDQFIKEHVHKGSQEALNTIQGRSTK